MPLKTQDKSRNAYQSVRFRPAPMVNNGWPKSSSAISFYASNALLIVNVLNGGYEWISHGPKFHRGFTAGLSYTMTLVGLEPINLGAHVAYIFMTGIGKNHFEFRLGGVYNFVDFLDSNNSSSDLISFKFLPVISFGYRYQPPGKETFLRLALSTAGLGVGYGFVFGPKSQPETQTREDFSF